MKKKVLVVGAAGGVGSLVVKRLLDEGNEVYGTVMNEDQGRELRHNYPSISGTAIAELGNADGIHKTLAPLLAQAGGLDAAIVCAAISPYGPLETTPLNVLRRTLEINAIAGLAVYQSVIPLLRASRGRMILISSMAGKVAFPFIGHYAISKFALEAMVDVMRRECRGWGVEFVAIEPGGIKTSMVTEQIRTIAIDKAALSPEINGLYGKLYEGFESVLKSGYSTATPPETVADVIIEALRAVRPETRYVVGPDAESLVALSKTLSDREFDDIAKLEPNAETLQ